MTTEAARPTDTEIRDRDVFEAMGWRYTQTWQGKGGGWLAPHVEGGKTPWRPYLPPVMSNPSSPEAWAAVPLMLEWCAGRGWDVAMLHASNRYQHGVFIVYGGARPYSPREHLLNLWRDDFSEVVPPTGRRIGRIAESGNQPLPAAVGEAIVRAIREGE